MLLSYIENKRWRDSNRDQWNEGKKRNYAQGRENASNSKESWTSDDDSAICAENRPSDRELAKQLGRSVQAIQVRRTRLLKSPEQ